MVPPALSDAHAKLERLLGVFEVDETLAPSPGMPEGGTTRARSTSTLDCGGRFVVTEYAQLDGEQVTFEGHGVYGYDPDEDCYTMYWFDSMTPGGFTTPARGTWDGDTLVFRSERPGRHGRYTYQFNEAGYTFQLEQSEDGQRWTPLMSSVYRRKP